MKFAREGWWWILPLIGIDIGWHIHSLPTIYNPWVYFFVLTLPTVLGILLLASFFRIPERAPEKGFNPETSILCPSDGQLVAIEQENGCLSYYIEMHLHNAHITRAPLSGTVTSVVRQGGNHHMVYFFKKVEALESKPIRKNARSIITFEDNHKRCFDISLICGAFFRRARPYVKPGDIVQKGDLIGAILFGSTIKVTLPQLTEGSQYTLVAKVGDKVKGGKTILCTNPSPSSPQPLEQSMSQQIPI